MAILRKDPNDFWGYRRWCNNGIYYDIWFKSSDVIIVGWNYHNDNLPQEICRFLNKWNKIMAERKKNFREMYPVKNAKIEFIFKEEVYRLLPCSVGAEEESFFEDNQRDIRDDLEKTLGIDYSRYFGMLD